MGNIKKMYTREFKEEILQKVKEGSKSTADIARDYGMKPDIIYRWVARSTQGLYNPLLQINRLKRENTELLRIIGELTRDLKKGEKISGN